MVEWRGVLLTCPRRLVQFECWCIDGFPAKLDGRRSSVCEAAIHLQRSQDVFKRLMNEIAHDRRVRHQGLIAPLGRVPAESVAPDYCSA